MESGFIDKIMSVAENSTKYTRLSEIPLYERVNIMGFKFGYGNFGRQLIALSNEYGSIVLPTRISDHCDTDEKLALMSQAIGGLSFTGYQGKSVLCKFYRKEGEYMQGEA